MTHHSPLTSHFSPLTSHLSLRYDPELLSTCSRISSTDTRAIQKQYESGTRVIHMRFAKQLQYN